MRLRLAVSTMLMCVALVLLPACGPLQIVIEYPTAPATAAPTPQPEPTFQLEPTPQPAPTRTPTLPAGAGNLRFRAGTPLSLVATTMLSQNLGWGLGQAGAGMDDHVLRTMDGGASWRDVTPPGAFEPETEGYAAAANFMDANRAWALFYARSGNPQRDSLAVWSTRDAGATWSRSAPLDTTGFEQELFLPAGMGFSDAQHGWLLAHLGAGASNDPIVLYTTGDGGETWERVVDPARNNLSLACAKTGAAFSSAQTGWITGDCGGIVPGVFLFKTTDGGQTWQPQVLPAPADLPNLFKGEASACGAAAPFFVPESSFGFLSVRCFPNGAARPRSWLYATANGGKTWQPLALPELFPYGAIDFISPNVGWYLGASSLDATADVGLYRTTDGGQTWDRLTSLGWTGPLDFADGQNGWVTAHAGDARALVHTTNGGATWREIKPVAAP